jgi:hypothetical protein
MGIYIEIGWILGYPYEPAYYAFTECPILRVTPGANARLRGNLSIG